jgi:hypothetical protein
MIEHCLQLPGASTASDVGVIIMGATGGQQCEAPTVKALGEATHSGQLELESERGKGGAREERKARETKQARGVHRKPQGVAAAAGGWLCFQYGRQTAAQPPARRSRQAGDSSCWGSSVHHHARRCTPGRGPGRQAKLGSGSSLCLPACPVARHLQAHIHPRTARPALSVHKHFTLQNSAP